MRLIKDILILISFFCLSAGTYYGGAKFHVPWYGSNDFSEYYKMTVAPFENSAEAPFAYRVLTPTIAHYIHKYEIFYDSKSTPFKDYYFIQGADTYMSSVLGAMIFTNYIFLAIGAFFTYKSILINLKGGGFMGQIVALGIPSLSFLTLSTVVHGYAGLTEGVTIFFISLLCYLAITNRLILFTGFCFLSVLQRELVPLILLLYVSTLPRLERKVAFVFSSSLAFSLYFLIKFYFQIPGNEHQTQISELVHNLLNFSLSKEFLFQGILANNITIFVLLLSVALDCNNTKPFFPYIFICIVLLILGVATGIGNNVGRILNMTTPILLLGIAEAINFVQTCKGGNHARIESLQKEAIDINP
jgi:hypothetical protein